MSLAMTSLRAEWRLPGGKPFAGPPPRLFAVGLAVMAHAALLALLLLAVVRNRPDSVAPAAFAIVLTAPRAPGAEAPPPSVRALARTDIRPQPVIAQPVRPMLRATMPTLRVAAATPPVRAARPAPSQPRSIPTPAVVAGAPAQQHPATPVADDGAALASLTARIDRAVQDAAFMPEAARRQRRGGRAQVAFTYANGTIDGITLAQSSASRVLDDAAISAVRQAAYPAAPALLRGRRLALLVWVDFHLQADNPG